MKIGAYYYASIRDEKC